MEQKNEIRIDYHFADNATPAFIGVFVTTKEAYQAGESPDADDVVQITVNPRDSVVCDLLEDAAESACKAANEASPNSGAQALSVAAKSLDDSGKIKNPAVAKFAEALRAASRKMTKPTYFVAATKVFELVADPSLWVKAGATTLDGAKRLAIKNACGTTFTARVATENAKGEIQTIAELHNSSAITRRRPKWRVCVG